ncbi:MAG: ferredoxin [Planctomycetes bacterium]|nr:ferredoxin [Planctomycetota bacterium]
MPEYDPKKPEFYDKRDLRASVEKALDICNGCRLCYNLCGSFPALFASAERHDDDMTKVTAPEIDKIVDECFQCKVCYERCPYTPDQGHSYNLDFPRLMQRALAQRVKEHGVPFRDRMLGSPDFIGKLSSGPAAPIVNFANESEFHRGILAKLAGISPKKTLPKFAGKTFSSFAKRHKSPASATGSVAYFATCFVDYNSPRIGKAVTAVLERQSLAVSIVTGVCCGMPKWANGDIDGATAHAAENVRLLAPMARAGNKIIVTNPTCSMQIRDEFPRLLGTEDATIVSKQTRDFGHYLSELSREGKLNGEFKKSPGKVRYHVPCHLRAQKIGQPMQQILARAGAEVETVRACSGHDGTWSMKTENFENSMKWGENCFKGMRDAGGAACASDCPLAAIQIRQATGIEVKHPAEVLADAYGLDI